MNSEWITLAQKIIGVKPDGFIGSTTHEAVNKYLSQKKVKKYLKHLPDIDAPEFTIGYKLIAVIQIHAKLKNVEVGEVDGYPGPLTENAIDILLNESKFKRPDEIDTNFPSEKDLEKFYGKPGENLGKAKIPFELLIAWDLRTRITEFACHEKVVKSVEKCYGRVLDHYGEEKIAQLRLNRFGGCFNLRKKRGGTTWSTHAWGIAIDTDPLQNKLQWNHKRANLARPEYSEWFKIWEDAGWVSLGRTKDFDWMHIQAAKVK